MDPEHDSGSRLEEAESPEGFTFLGEPDGARRLALAQGEITEIERGRGGRSMGFRLTLADGTRGYFKPEQEFSGAHWFSELAAYYLDRALGLGRVPPSIGRSLEWAPLRRAAGDDRRVNEVNVQADGRVRGAFIWWIPERLIPLRTGVGWERWIRMRGGIELTPFQRPSEYRSDVRRNADLRVAQRAGDTVDFSVLRGDGPRAGPPDTPDRAAELSDLILFDYLTSNVDRWGGNNTNIRTRGPSGPLIYLDNGAGFWPNAHLSLMETRLRMVQRFRRSTVAAIRGLNLSRLRELMATDPLAPLLSERLVTGIGERAERLVEHVDRTRERFGDQIWLE